MDLDIGCKRRLDPLLQGDWDVILPRTKPVSSGRCGTPLDSDRASWLIATNAFYRSESRMI
jgi:hypothetical protein